MESMFSSLRGDQNFFDKGVPPIGSDDNIEKKDDTGGSTSDIPVALGPDYGSLMSRELLIEDRVHNNKRSATTPPHVLEKNRYLPKKVKDTEESLDMVIRQAIYEAVTAAKVELLNHFENAIGRLKTGIIEAIVEHTNRPTEEITTKINSIGNGSANKATYSHAVGDNSEALIIRTIQSKRNEDERHAADRKRRGKNLMIHRLKEDDAETREETLEKAKALTNHLGSDPPVRAIRIGLKKAGANRPIMVTMESEIGVESFFRNIKNLRSAPESLKGLSITEDNTPEERKEIKEMHSRAQQHNKNNPEEFHKVVGSARNRTLRIINAPRRLQNE